MAHIAFVHSPLAYDGSTFRTMPLGGTESATVQLAEALAARGHRVTVLTGIEKPLDLNGVSWQPISAENPVVADVAIANSNASDLHYVKAPKRIVWILNTRAFDRFLRKGGALATFRYLPAAVMIGDYHASQVSWMIPYSRRFVIPLAAGEPFNTATPGDAIPRPRAIHLSQPYRDAQGLVRIWIDLIRPKVEAAELHIFAGDWRPEGVSDAVLAENGIVLRERQSREGLAREMRDARVMLYRGYKDETFCLAAAESIAMGVPVVTAGIGSLKERVRHDETGLIGVTDEEFAESAARVLTDDTLWSRLHEDCLASRSENDWDAIAAKWEEAFL